MGHLRVADVLSKPKEHEEGRKIVQLAREETRRLSVEDRRYEDFAEPSPTGNAEDADAGKDEDDEENDDDEKEKGETKEHAGMERLLECIEEFYEFTGRIRLQDQLNESGKAVMARLQAALKLPKETNRTP